MSMSSFVPFQVLFSWPRRARAGGSVGPTTALLFLAAAVSSIAACDSESRTSATGDAGSAGDAGGPPLNAVTATGLAIVSSDFAVTSVALYDVATGRLKDDCVHSGVTGPNLAQELSGDVTLPTQTQHRRELALIDRKNAVVTYVTPGSCAARLQFSVSTGGFKSNPHDLISVSAEKAYVTRYEKNPAPSADTADFDDGDDLLVVNPSTGAILKSISLSGEVPAGSDPSILARPDRGVLADGKVYVTLGNVSADFGMVGTGRVVVIDPVTDMITGGIDLPDHKGCSALEYQATSKRLYVSCGGAFTDGPDQAAKSALVEIDLSGATPTIARTIAAIALGGQSLNFTYAAVFGETAFLGTLGTFPMGAEPGTSDGFFAVSLSSGAPTKLLGGGAYNFGRAAVDVAGKKVFLPDGDAVTPRVRIFDASVDPIVAVDPFEPNPAGHLPPREVAWY